MNLHQFRFVQEAVRRNLNLTEAAKALHTSQPGVSKAIIELEEELGIKIAEKDLTDLSGLAGCNQGVYLSPGASDETLRFFSFTRDVTEEEMASMNGRCTGLISEGEQITLKIVPLDDLLTVADAKTIVAYALYQKYLAV